MNNKETKGKKYEVYTHAEEIARQVVMVVTLNKKAISFTSQKNNNKILFTGKDRPFYVPCSSANPFIGTLEVPVTN